jgi:hypothetical protein
MTAFHRRSILAGIAALAATPLARPAIAQAQAPSGPFRLDPLPYGRARTSRISTRRRWSCTTGGIMRPT